MKPNYETSYQFCEGCERRIHKSLFEDKQRCNSCRGFWADGTKMQKVKRAKSGEEEIVNT